MDALAPPLLPRCSTVLGDGSFRESSTSSSTSSLTSKSSSLEYSSLLTAGNLTNFSKAIESLNLAAISPIPKTSSGCCLLWPDDGRTGLTDSAYRSSSRRSSDVGFGSAEDDVSVKSEELCLAYEAPFGEEELHKQDFAIGSHPEPEPEAEAIEQFRPYGVRFIRSPDRYSGCKCAVPRQLIEWTQLMHEVTITAAGSHDPLPLCFHYRWAEVKQDFCVDLFGDLQFQDFLLARDQRGPYHAMIHFAGIFADVGFDGSYFYWVLIGDCEEPLVESKHRRKGTFVDSLRTMVREQFRQRKSSGMLCPEPMPDAHLYVRADETAFSREADFSPGVGRSPCELPDASLEQLQDDFFAEDKVRMVNGQRAPRELSYLQLYPDEDCGDSMAF